MIRTSVDKVHESSTAIELGEENSSVGLRIRTLDPVQTRSNTAIFTATFAKNSATITTHPHFDQEQQWQKGIGSIKLGEKNGGKGLLKFMRKKVQKVI